MANQYYTWWKQNKACFSLLPAIVFWVVSMIFFMVGLSFKNPIVVFGIDLSLGISLSLSISNTIIQIIGNDQEPEGLGLALWIGWIGSYMLGIGTNIVGLMSILEIKVVALEWIIAIGLGTMIEVLPEKLIVQFLKNFKGSVVPSKIVSSSAYDPQRNVPRSPAISNPNIYRTLPKAKH